jgi:hypothetical protein
MLLTYVWLACPLTLLAANSGSNDPLVGVLVLIAVCLATAPATRAATIAAAAMTKFAPLALFPLLIRSWKAVAAAAAVLAASFGLILILDGGLGEFSDRAIRFQVERDSPFSVWGLYDLDALQVLAQLAAVGLIGVLALRGRRDPVGLAAACAAALIAVQLGVSHWFYLYIVWFLPVALVALAGGYVVSSGRRTGSIETALPGSSQRITTPISHGSSSAAL